MAIQVQYRRGTGAENDSFTGAVGEITVDTTAQTLRIHDGSTAGGSNIATTQYVIDSIGNISGSAIENGSSNVAILSVGGDVTSYVGGALVATTTTSGVSIVGNVDASANVNGGNIVATNDVTTSTVSATGAINTDTVVIATGNVTGGNLTTTGDVTTATVTASGAITSATTIDATGNITATGNVEGSFLLGNGFFISGLPASYGNTEVAAFLPTYTGNLVSLTGDVTTTANVSATNLTGTVLTASQTNITAVGALTAGSIASGFGTINIGANNLTVGNILAGAGNAVANIGSTSDQFNTVHALATSAQYADVAEYYVADDTYDVGTVLVFGGKKEVTTTNTASDPRVAGVVSESPAVIMNSGERSPTRVALALLGRVPCRVMGKINKGDRIVSSAFPGVACAYHSESYEPGCIIGKALEDYENHEQPGIIEIAVGKT